VFALWWLYFLVPCGEALERHRERSYLWGYGHYGVFASLAALGAGLEVAIEQSAHEAAVSPTMACTAVAVPVAAFLVCHWGVNAVALRRAATAPGVIGAAAVAVLALPLVAPVTGPALVIAAIAMIAVAVVAVTVLTRG
jgi:low temperature requirement protein LtrA